MENLDAYRRDLMIDLDEGQLRRLNRIWTTDSCPRRQYHRIMGDVDPLPVHYMSWKGSAVHRIIENSLVGEGEVYIDWSEFPDQKQAVIDEAEDHVAKFNRWMESSPYDFTGAIMEAKYEIELPLGYTKVRKIDVVTPTHQFDWKTGKKRNTIDARVGLVSGWDAVRKAGEGEYPPENLILVFTGGPEVEELAPFTNKKTPIEQALEKMTEKDNQNIFHREQIKAGNVPPCKISFFCGMCNWRHKCRGI